MDKRTRSALEKSIDKWRRIVAGTGVDAGYTNCALCNLFWPGCGGCPVLERTKMPNCVGTPYSRWASEVDSGGRWKKKRGVAGWEAGTKRLKEIAREERDFLKSLRPRR